MLKKSKMVRMSLVLFLSTVAADARHGLPYGQEWINRKVSESSIRRTLSGAGVRMDAIAVNVEGGRVAIIGAVNSAEQLESINSSLNKEPYIIEALVNVGVYSNLYGRSESLVEGTKDLILRDRINASISRAVSRREGDNVYDNIFTSVVDNRLAIVGWSNSENFLQTIIESIKSDKYLFGRIDFNQHIHSLTNMVIISEFKLPPVDVDRLARLVQGRNALIEDKSERFALLLHAGLACLDAGELSSAETLFRQASLIDQTSYFPNYGMAIVAAERHRYEDALQSLKLAVSLPSFDLTRSQVELDFKNHPILLGHIPTDIKTLAFQTIQMFELRNQLMINQQRFATLVPIEQKPFPHTQEARRSLSAGNFDASYINYMRGLSDIDAITDENINEVLEALSAWRFAYIMRVVQVMAAFGGSAESREIDPRFMLILPDYMHDGLRTIAGTQLPSIVNSYHEHFQKLLIGNERMNNMTQEMVLLSLKYQVLFGAVGNVVLMREEVNERRRGESFAISTALPTFQILDWKEAAIDYWDQKKRFDESIKLLEAIIEQQKRQGQLTSDSLAKLAEARNLLIQYEIYADKLYRAFLFDMPMSLALAGFQEQIKHAYRPFPRRNDHESLEQTARAFIQLTGLIQYLALNETSDVWNSIVQQLKEHLGDRRYEQLKQIAVTQPNWLENPHKPRDIR